MHLLTYYNFADHEDFGAVYEPAYELGGYSIATKMPYCPECEYLMPQILYVVLLQISTGALQMAPVNVLQSLP